MRVVTHAQKLQRKRYGAYLVRPFHVLRQEAWHQEIEKEDMYTCKWCYKQVIPNLEDRHFECKRKIRRQSQIRKLNIDGLASATDRRFIGATNKTSLRVIGSRSRLDDK